MSHHSTWSAWSPAIKRSRFFRPTPTRQGEISSGEFSRTSRKNDRLYPNSFERYQPISSRLLLGSVYTSYLYHYSQRESSQCLSPDPPLPPPEPLQRPPPQRRGTSPSSLKPPQGPLPLTTPSELPVSEVSRRSTLPVPRRSSTSEPTGQTRSCKSEYASWSGLGIV